MKRSTKLIYLDHAATTPVDPRVLKAMQPYWSEKFANPSALYKSGRDANAAVNEARAGIAEILNCKPSEIIFTAGGTESNNLAIFGMAKAYQKKYRKPGHIITTAIEHHSVLHVIDELKSYGWKVSYAPTDKDGFVDLVEIKKLVRNDTALVSVMYANNEVGTVEPIAEIGKWLNGLNKVRVQKNLPRILFHTDACQAGGALSLNTQELKVDLLTLNGSKIYGPKQIAILFVRTGVELEPVIQGGGQERNMRSGTENVPSIVGLATALRIAQKDLAKENKRLLALQEYLIKKIRKEFKHSSLNGPDASLKTRLPNNINLTFKDVEGETLMLYLDAAGVAVSTGSACATTSLDPSHVLVALGIPKKEAYNAIRITTGRTTTKKDLDYLFQKLKEILKIIPKS
jgi:cysteine desulfurase